ncbi:MAG: T9SS type A sorting domain-containing protein [Bacteroidetes bacterium]|nr:T9SS type A sorting domain-containing protein [Bacteroidota bacterium]
MKHILKNLTACCLLLLASAKVFGQIHTPVYPTAAGDLTRGYGNSALTVQVAWTATCNGDTITIRLPEGITYVPGSVTKTGGTQTIAEADISNLRTPRFVVSNITGTGDIIFTILRKAGCGSLASGKDSVYVKGSCGTAQETSGIVNTYNIFAPSISLTPPAAIGNAVIGTLATRTLTVTNGGNGAADTVFFYIVYPSAGMQNASGSNTITANGANFTPWRTNGDTLFYRIFGATLFGGDNLLTNGESITITEPVRVRMCNSNTFYGAGWGVHGRNVCSYTTRTGSVSMRAGVANFSAVSQSATGFTSYCNSFDQNVTLTNGGTGDDTAGGMYNIRLRIGYVYSTFTSPLVGLTTFSFSNARINGNVISSFTFSGGIGTMNLNNLFTTDPDGAGGLTDLDGDGYFDDLPRGQSLTYTVTATADCNYRNTCGRDIIVYPGTDIRYNTMCGTQQLTARFFGGNMFIYESAFTGTSYVPANIVPGTPFRIQLKTGFYNNQNPMENANTRYEYYLKLPPGASVSGSGNPTYGASSVSYTQSNDTVFIKSPSTALSTAGINLVYTCGAGGNVTFNYGLYKIIDDVAGCRCNQNIMCGSVFGKAICPGCVSLGPVTYVPTVRRSAGCLGWTNAAMTTRQVASSISAYDLSKALFLDTLEITGSGRQVSNVTNLYQELRLVRASNTNRLEPLNIVVDIIRGGSSVANYTISSFTDNSSGNVQNVTWDLSSGLPAGAMLAGDSVYTRARYVVRDNATLPQQDIQTGLTYQYYSIIAGVREGCNDPVPEMYLVGTTAVDGRNGWNATGCSPVSDNMSHLARRFNTSGQLFATEFRPVFLIDSFVVTYPPTYTPGTVTASFTNASHTFVALTPTQIRGRVHAFYNPGTWFPTPLTVTNTYGDYVRYPMFPTCRTNANQVHNVKFYIKDYYYALGTRATYPSQYIYSYGNTSANIAQNNAGFSQTIVYNSTGTPNPVAQNLTGTVVGTANQHTWDIQLSNIGLQTASYLWFAVNRPAGSLVTIDSVRRLSTNTTLAPIANGASGNWYQVSAAGLPSAGTETLRIFFKYASCNPDSVRIQAGWNCTAYPSPNPLTDTNACSQASVLARVTPATSEVQLSVQRHPGNGSTIDLCTTDSVIVQVNSAQAANLISPRVEVVTPTGVTVTGVVRVEYPLGSGNWQTATTNPIAGGINVNLNTHSGISSNGLPGTIANPGAAGRQAAVKLYYTTSCALTSGTSFTFRTYGNKPCGEPAVGNGVINKSNGINITGASVTGGMGLTLTLANDTFRCGGATKTLSLGVTPVLTSTQAGDTAYYTLPAGMSYAGSFTPGANCATCTATPVAGVANTTIVKIKLDAGVSSGTNIGFTFGVSCDPNVGCGNTQIDAEMRRQITPLLCGGVPCVSSSVVMGSASRNVVIYKPSLAFATYQGAYVTGLPQFIYTYSGSIVNTSTFAAVTAGTQTVLETWWDVDYNNAFDPGIDRLVRTRTYTGAIAAGGGILNFIDTFQYTGGLPPDPIRAMFTVIRTSTAPNCNCTPLVMTSMVYSLPVNWVSFSAVKKPNSTVLLNWRVEQDPEVTQYEVERKISGQTAFTTVGTINAVAGSTLAYSFSDPVTEAFKDVVYYRIKSVERNGEKAYSEIKSVIFREYGTAANTFAFWPNPANTHININVATEDGFSYTISNSKGQTLLRGVSNLCYCTADVSNLSNGVYILTVTDHFTGNSEKLLIIR